MIVFVCFVVALYSSLCQSQRYDGDSRLHSYEIDKQEMRVNTGTPLTLKCPHTKGMITWESRPCHPNIFGLCDANNEESPWQMLNQTKNRITFDSAEKSGIYRCKDRHLVKRIFVVNVVPPGYEGSPPYVAPLKMSNLTDQINMEFTIQCNVTSEIPPTIVWFKKCYGHKCDMPYKGICYCRINTSSVSHYRMGNIHLSKYTIFNARDVDSGLYACVAITQHGENSQTVNLTVPTTKNQNESLSLPTAKNQNESFSLLFLIPIMFLLVPFSVWLCYYWRKKKSVIIIVDQQKQLIRPVVRINIDATEII